ncbi:hypothetical protein PWT90_04078 [Aphanocladium album]|nr:hypothetical protein PWT90_04078 [Aphanocladium album]
MRYLPASKRLSAVLILLLLSVLSYCHRLGEQALVLRPSHHSRALLNRAASGPDAEAIDHDYAFPVAYDFGKSESITASTIAYPLPTMTHDDGEPSLTSSSASVQNPPTATTEPRSPVGDGPEIGTTSSAAVSPSLSDITEAPSSSSTDFSSATSPLFESSEDAASQTDARRDETVTVTVTNFISSQPSHTKTTSSSLISNNETSSFLSTSSGSSDVGDVTVITVTSLHTITLSVGHSASPTQRTISGANSTSVLETTSGQVATSLATSSRPATSSDAKVSIITITRTEIYTGMTNATSTSTSEATSKEIVTSTISLPYSSSHIPPFSVSFNLSSAPGPSVSSVVSGAVTSLHPSPSVTTRTVFQNITLTLSEVPQTESRETGATHTGVPTLPPTKNTTVPASSSDNLSTLYPGPTSPWSSNTTIFTSTVSAVETSDVSLTTKVVTITVYPTSLETTTANGTAAQTSHSSGSTSVVASPPYPSNTSSSSVFKTGGLTAASDLPLTTGGTGSWTAGLSTASTNSTVIGTLLNTTTPQVGSTTPQPTSIDTTCEHTRTAPGSAITGTAYSSGSVGASTNVDNMLFRQLALATVATSFVIIPEISEHDENIFKTLPIEDSDSAFAYNVPESAFDQSISVPCSDCKGRNTQLRLDFTVEDDTKLLLNGFELYPDADPWSGDLQATVINGHRQPKNQKLGYSLAVYPRVTAKEDSMELIEVDLKIIEVGTRFVDGVPAVKVDLIKAPGGSIAMSTVAIDQPLETACTTIWCRAKELADKVWAQVHEMKGCSKSATSELGSEAEYVDLADANIPDVEFIPEIDEPAMPSREEWRHLMKSIASHIIMPILMGVTAGVAVAFLALCIQSMARRLSSVVRGKRSGEPRTGSSKALHKEQATADEKAQLMA